MEEQKLSISGLYYRYKQTSDNDIEKHLKTIKIVVLKDNGIGTTYGYYPLSQNSMDKILESPRSVSLSYDATETDPDCLEGLSEYKTIRYLVKSTSRFFLKPDIGEIFDQIHYRDLLSDKIKAIQYIPSALETLDDTQGEHFILEAKLLI